MRQALLVLAAALVVACGTTSTPAGGAAGGSGGTDAGAGNGADAGVGGGGTGDAGSGGGVGTDAGTIGSGGQDAGAGTGGAGSGGGPPPPPADACAGMTPAELPRSVVASLPDSDCLGGTSDDGVGNYLLGCMVGADPVFPGYFFFTVKDGQAQRIGDTLFGGDETGTFVFSQPSGFSSFNVFGGNGGSHLASFTHEGATRRDETVAEGNFASSPTSMVGIDPSGGTALVRSAKDGTGSWVTSYRRLDKTGAPRTDWIPLDSSSSQTFARAVGVALSGDALIFLSGPSFANWRARWVDPAGTPLTGWFALDEQAGVPNLQFLMDGSLALRFRATRFPFAPGPWKARFEDAREATSPAPEWLKERTGNSLFVIRNGAAYASWGVAGHCDSGLEVIAAGTGQSCGCLGVPNLGNKASIGRDGSLIVPRPEPSANKCQYDLYPQLLK
jgi:hypothetical protein